MSGLVSGSTRRRNSAGYLQRQLLGIAMLSTRQVLDLLSDTNPNHSVTEDRLRTVLRRNRIRPPSVFAGRFAWSRVDVEALATELDLDVAWPADTEHSASRTS